MEMGPEFGPQVPQGKSLLYCSGFVLYFQPLYGFIEAKLEMITHAYFRERDFSQVALLEETYCNMNSCLMSSLLSGPQLYCGKFLKV